MNGEEPPSHQAHGAADPLAGTLETLASLTAAARSGGLETAAALTSLTAARRLAAELDRGELALIEAARDSGATWAQIAAAMGTRNRQTAQKRHADLSRRCPRPPVVDTAPPETPGQPGVQDEAGRQHPAGVPGTRKAARLPPRSEPAAPGATRGSTVGKPREAPKITPGIIGAGQYELVKAPDHAETRAWHVLVGGKRAGLVRPTWHGERSRVGWEAVDNAGTALPATGTGRVTAGGNARTRDAAAISLLRTLLRQQENDRRRKAAQ